MTGPPHDDPAEQSLAGQIDGVCDAFEEAWRAGSQPQIEQYIQGWQEPERGQLFAELLRVDLEIRRRDDSDTFAVNDYYGRFPDYRQHIDTAVREAVDAGRDASTRVERRPTPPDDLAPSDRIGDFELEQRLGEGAFAVVFRAYQRQMNRFVALKISHRGQDEPPTLGQLDHPNIVRVFGVERVPERRLQLLAMEFADGGTLQNVIDRIDCEQPPTGDSPLRAALQEASGRVDPLKDAAWGGDAGWEQIVCLLGAQLADALHYAHQKGVLHRDVKPANILLTSDGTPKLADFNTAFDENSRVSTPGGYFGGTFAYMSPEQLAAIRGHLRPEQVDCRSDIYSLGVVLSELLRGRIRDANPRRVDDGARAQRRLDQLATAGLPAGLQQVLARCLAVDPAQRYQSAGELAVDLRLCANPRIQTLTRPPTGGIIGWAFRHPLAATLFIALVPNLILSWINVFYDYWVIVKPHCESDRPFWTVIVWGKLLLYSSGVAVGLWRGVHVFHVLTRGAAGDADRARRARAACLWIGDLVFWITFACWVVSGALFPRWMDFLGAGFHSVHYLVFFVAHLLCGMVSGTMAYFALTFLMTRIVYPRLLSDARESSGDTKPHEQLRWRLEVFFVVAIISLIFTAAGLGWLNNAYGFWFLGLLLVLSLSVFWLSVVAKAEIRSHLTALDEFVAITRA